MHRAGRSQPDPCGDGGSTAEQQLEESHGTPMAGGWAGLWRCRAGLCMGPCPPGVVNPPHLSYPGACASVVCRAWPWGAAPPSTATVLPAPTCTSAQAGSEHPGLNPEAIAAGGRPSRLPGSGSGLAPGARAGGGHGAGTRGPCSWESGGQSLRVGCSMPWDPRLLLRALGSLAPHAAGPAPRCSLCPSVPCVPVLPVSWCSDSCCCRCIQPVFWEHSASEMMPHFPSP